MLGIRIWTNLPQKPASPTAAPNTSVFLEVSHTKPAREDGFTNEPGPALEGIVFSGSARESDGSHVDLEPDYPRRHYVLGRNCKSVS